MSANTGGNLYEQFAPAERATLLLQAMAREDEGEAQRLRNSCPRRIYSEPDDAFTARMDFAFAVTAGVCADLWRLMGKIQTLELTAEVVAEFAAMHHVTAGMAFMEGVACAEGRPQLHYFAKALRPLPVTGFAQDADGRGEEGEGEDGGEDEGRAEEDGEDADGDAAADDSQEAAGEEDDEDDAAGDGRRLDVSGRMEAVDRRSEHATDCMKLVLLAAARAVAQEMVNGRAALDRFARARLGVGAATLLAAWEFPAAKALADVLGRYAYLKPHEAGVLELLAYLRRQWDEKFAPDDDDDAGGDADEH